MKKSLLIIAVSLGFTALLQADSVPVANDDASQPAYSSGWKSDGGGTGFGIWILQNVQKPEVQSHSGFYIADTHNNPDLNGVAVSDKAFGLFANGTEFENASAFRAFNKPLEPGDSFSFTVEHGELIKKGDYDEPGGSSIGLTLRSGTQVTNVDDYNKGARFEFGIYKDKPNYQIFDGDSNTDSGIPFTDGGLKITFKLVSADSYDLEVTSLKENKTVTLTGRKLGGTQGAALDNFCIFDRNGEKFDAYFNSFSVTKDSTPAAPVAPAPKL